MAESRVTTPVAEVLNTGGVPNARVTTFIGGPRGVHHARWLSLIGTYSAATALDAMPGELRLRRRGQAHETAPLASTVSPWSVTLYYAGRPGECECRAAWPK
jgi:hypothetical protein